MLSLGERSRLKTDHNYMMGKVLGELKKQDKFGRGLVTAASFSKVLDDFGFHYGTPEVSKLLEFCHVTSDGFVLYKNLSNQFQPEPPRAKTAETDNFLLKANDLGLAQDGGSQGNSGPSSRLYKTNGPGDIPLIYDQQNMKEFLSRQTEEIRKAYSRWDRGMISDTEFNNILEKDIGIPLTDEYRHVLSVYGPSRNLSFQKLLVSLRVDNFLNKPNSQPRLQGDAHKIFSNRENNATKYKVAEAYPHDDRQRQKPCTTIRRNPITWDAPAGSDASLQEKHDANGKIPEEISRAAFIRNAICNFCDGNIGSWVFRQQLAETGVIIDLYLDRLIRQHEGDNSVKVADFMFVVRKAENRESMGDVAESVEGPVMPPPAQIPQPFNPKVLTTPYATDFTVEQQVHSMVPKDEFPESKLNKSAKQWKGGLERKPAQAAKNSGDIISWKDGSDDAEAIRKTPFAEQCAAVFGEPQGNIITWNNSTDGSGSGDGTGQNQNSNVNGLNVNANNNNSPSQERRSKKIFEAQQGTRIPFGTDADKGTTLEQAGTMEFRAASSDQGRRAY